MKINVWTLRLHGYQESVFWREALKGSLSAKRAGRRRVLIEGGGGVLLTPLSLKMAMDGCDWDTDNHLTDTAHDYEDDQTLRRQWSGYCKLTNLLLIWRWVGKIEKHPNMKVGERVEFLRRRWNGKQIGDWGKCGSQPGLGGWVGVVHSSGWDWLVLYLGSDLSARTYSSYYGMGRNWLVVD